MSTGAYLGYTGGILAITAGLVSTIVQKPLITLLTGISFMEGSLLILAGLIGITGGLIAMYYSYKKNGLYVITGGILGLLAPCSLAILAVIGGYLIMKESK